MIYQVGIILLLFIMIAYQSYERSKLSNFHHKTVNRIFEACNKEREEWKEERQQLLDRIQSPTFAEYKHQEVKVIKAKNGTDKPDIVIEQL